MNNFHRNGFWISQRKFCQKMQRNSHAKFFIRNIVVSYRFSISILDKNFTVCHFKSVKISIEIYFWREILLKILVYYWNKFFKIFVRNFQQDISWKFKFPNIKVFTKTLISTKKLWKIFFISILHWNS